MAAPAGSVDEKRGREVAACGGRRSHTSSLRMMGFAWRATRSETSVLGGAAEGSRAALQGPRGHAYALESRGPLCASPGWHSSPGATSSAAGRRRTVKALNLGHRQVSRQSAPGGQGRKLWHHQGGGRFAHAAVRPPPQVGCARAPRRPAREV